MHLTRFVAALVLAEAVVLAGVAMERRNLEWRCAVSRRFEEIRQAEEQHARQLLRIGQLSAPPRVLERLKDLDNPVSAREQPSGKPSTAAEEEGPPTVEEEGASGAR